MELFLQRHPTSVQSILAAVTDLKVDKAAEIADKIIEVNPSPVKTFSVARGAENSLDNKLLKEIERLHQRIDDISFPKGTKCGVAATTKLICKRYVWPHMKKTIKLWVQTCEQCQRSKIQRHTKAPLGTFELPDARFSQVHLDLSEVLPVVLLGIRTAVKEDVNASCAELLYGTPLRLPSDMIENNITQASCTERFVTNLVNNMRNTNPFASSPHSATNFYVHPSPISCSHVFVRINRVQKPLSQPYADPYKVLSRKPNVFKMT
ncbi:hypothetical protein JTE90_016145 [Oedothorax gibbosus]|uniref:Integrase zinc-binding domain-containing protein n=1 Tax=Oedothorax gibbosus TaxID=931172 RepID=A0AAV6TKG7_9ARAC|nr:hypothetical protein JTE90_016145 [Oedothorax gibbosus]